jgi:hypothetical protein
MACFGGSFSKVLKRSKRLFLTASRNLRRPCSKLITGAHAAVYRKTVEMLNLFENYYAKHCEAVSECIGSKSLRIKAFSQWTHQSCAKHRHLVAKSHNAFDTFALALK